MNIFRISDGRKAFYQWDSEQKLIISAPICSQVHFCNQNTEKALVVDVKETDGVKWCNVPNILLQEASKIKVYTYSIFDGCRTTHECIFDVIPRKKPESYIYTETEVINYETLYRKVDDIWNTLIKNNIYTELPTPSEEYRGIIAILSGNDEDTPYICLNLFGHYHWMGLSGGGDSATSILGSATLGTMILGR